MQPMHLPPAAASPARRCGSCCEHFIPDITHSEVAYIAAYLLFELKDEEMIERVYRHSGADARCIGRIRPSITGVSGTPLICRLHASTPTMTNTAKRSFDPAKYAETNTMPKHLDERVVTMQDLPTAYAP